MKPKRPISEIKVTNVPQLRDKAEYILKQHNENMSKEELYDEVASWFGGKFARPRRSITMILITDPNYRFGHVSDTIFLRSPLEIQEKFRANHVFTAGMGAK